MAIGDFFRDFFSGDSEGEYEGNGSEKPEDYQPQAEVNRTDDGTYRDMTTGEPYRDNEVRKALDAEDDPNSGNGDRNKRK